MKELIGSPDNYQERFEKIKEEVLRLPKIDQLGVEQIQNARDKIIARFPGFEEEIEFIFSVIRNSADQRIYDYLKYKHEGRIPSRESKELNTSFAESLYLGTDYILAHRDEKAYLLDLMNLCDRLSRLIETGNRRSGAWEAEKRGLIGQVGVYRLMEKLNLSPSLAKPEDDAFKKVDFWGKSGSEILAVQGKCAGFLKKPAYLDSADKLEAWLAAEVEKVGEPYKDDAKRRADKMRKDYSTISKLKVGNNSVRPVAIILPRISIDETDGSLKEEYFKDFNI